MNKRCVGCEFRYNGKCQLIGQPVNLDAPCVFLNTTSKAINDLIELYVSKETELNTQLSQVQRMLHQLREFNSMTLLREYEELAHAKSIGPLLPHARKPDHFKLNDKIMWYNTFHKKWFPGIVSKSNDGHCMLNQVCIEVDNLIHFSNIDNASLLLKTEYEWFTNNQDKFLPWYEEAVK